MWARFDSVGLSRPLSASAWEDIARLPLCAEAQDSRFGSLSRRFSRARQITSRVCSQPTRPWTRSVGVEGCTRKAALCGDDAGVGDSTRSQITPRGTERYFGGASDRCRGRNPGSFPEAAQDSLGFELYRVQCGFDPKDWKPTTSVGPGVREIRVRDEAGIFRIIYLATRPEVDRKVKL
jgi:hypothetical protein